MHTNPKEAAFILKFEDYCKLSDGVCTNGVWRARSSVNAVDYKFVFTTSPKSCDAFVSQWNKFCGM